MTCVGVGCRCPAGEQERGTSCLGAGRLRFPGGSRGATGEMGRSGRHEPHQQWNGSNTGAAGRKPEPQRDCMGECSCSSDSDPVECAWAQADGRCPPEPKTARGCRELICPPGVVAVCCLRSAGCEVNLRRECCPPLPNGEESSSETWPTGVGEGLWACVLK